MYKILDGGANEVGRRDTMPEDLFERIIRRGGFVMVWLWGSWHPFEPA